MIERNRKAEVDRLLDGNPAVVLIGPRQVGKTTLAHRIARERGAVYLDLERPRNLAKFADVEQFCEINADKLLVLDEVHRLVVHAGDESFPLARDVEAVALSRIAGLL